MAAVIEHTDKGAVHALIKDDPIVQLEAIDENALGVDGIVTVFAPDEPRPVNMLIVRWGQKNLGLGSVGLLRAARLTGLEEIVSAVPLDRGRYEMLLPFWASGAIMGSFSANVLGAEACYIVDREHLRPSPVARQCIRLDDPDIIKPMFPKLTKDAPAYVLSLKNELTSVAAVTHLSSEVARIGVYTVERARGRGFGRGVLTAVAEELLALKIVPTISVDLGQEGAVRMVEDAGFFQRTAHLKTQVLGRRAERAEEPLIRIGP
jgi:hypothetical protein